MDQHPTSSPFDVIFKLSTLSYPVYSVHFSEMVNKELRGGDEWNKTCRRLGFGRTIDRDQKSSAIFKIANNGAGEWRLNDRVAFNLPQKLFLSCRSAVDPAHVENLPVFLRRIPAVQTNALHQIYCVSPLNGCMLQRNHSLSYIVGLCSTDDEIKFITSTGLVCVHLKSSRTCLNPAFLSNINLKKCSLLTTYVCVAAWLKRGKC